MKSTMTRFLIVTVFVALAAAPRRAESKVTVLAALDSPMVAASESQSETSLGDATNVPAAESESQEESADKPDVRIDRTGVHVGGPRPVDINIPANVGHRSGGTAIDDVVGLVAVVLGISLPVAIVGLVLYFGHRRNRMVHETVRAMVEKGVPVTPELVAGLGAKEAKAVRPRSDLRKGLILTGVGVGLVMFLGKPGWIVLFIGVAFLVVWLVERKNQNGVQPPQ
jgi:Domain of unknown function (DUF6249)